jgi:hypothetical protein
MTAPLFRLPTLSYRIVAILLVLWGVAGVFAFYFHVTAGPEQIAAMSAFDRHAFLTRPGWFDGVYAVATGGGLLGAVALLFRRRIALPLFIVSLVAVVLQFGWVFLATDLIAAKGAGAVVPFPLVIFAIALFQIAVARHGRRRGWLR